MARPSAPRTKIAAAGTLAALAVLAGVATASKTAQQDAPKAVAAALAAPMRTVEVRRTVGVLTRPAAAPAAPVAAAPATTTASERVTTPAAAHATAARRSSPTPATDDESTAGPVNVAAEVPATGTAEDECVSGTTGGTPTTTSAASAAFTGHTSAATRRRAARDARRAERRARRTARRRAARARARMRMPLRTTHPLPQDVPGAVLDACGTVSTATPTTAGTPSAPAVQTP